MTRIGRYELLRKLGAGGMAEVHLSRARGFEGFEKLLVLKRILPHLAADAHFRQMFLSEARLAALLQHPNIVQVYDLGKDDAEFFFTMEFVYGENIYAISRAARKRREQVPIEHVVSIIIGAAAGLHYAHERVGMDGQPLGIVHRDVSPTNLMVTYDGCPKVADFGIAKVTNRTDVTQAGIRKGKVPYMSPEQCKAARVDRRSDVFALGICLYELSTGERLFDGDNEFGVMNRIVTGDVPLPSTRRSGFPKALERIIMKALCVDIDRRYPTCLHMQHDLEAFLRDARLDGSSSALAAWMHRVFKPQPFPWGALQGDGVTGGGSARPTIAGSGAGLGSRPGDIISRPDMTPVSGVGSHPMPSSANSVRSSVASGRGSYNTGPGSRTGTGVAASDGGTLKGIAMGLGIVATVAVLSVGGLVVYKYTQDDAPTTAAASVDDAAPADAAPSEPAPQAAAAPVATDPPAPVAATPVVAQPLAEPVAAEPTPPPAAAEPGAEEVVEDEVDEEVVEVIDEPNDSAPKPKSKASTKPKTPSEPNSKPKSKTKSNSAKPTSKKKGDASANPDAFWGG